MKPSTTNLAAVPECRRRHWGSRQRCMWFGLILSCCSHPNVAARHPLVRDGACVLAPDTSPSELALDVATQDCTVLPDAPTILVVDADLATGTGKAISRQGSACGAVGIVGKWHFSIDNNKSLNPGGHSKPAVSLIDVQANPCDPLHPTIEETLGLGQVGYWDVWPHVTMLDTRRGHHSYIELQSTEAGCRLVLVQMENGKVTDQVTAGFIVHGDSQGGIPYADHDVILIVPYADPVHPLARLVRVQ